MQRSQGNQTNSARYYILLSPVGTTWVLVASTVADGGATGQMPLGLRKLSREHNWKPIRDEIRGLADTHGLREIHEKNFNVEVGMNRGHLFASCEFKERSDAYKIFRWIQGHNFQGCVLNAKMWQPGQDPHELVDWPPNSPAPAPTDPSLSRPRGSREPFGPWVNQVGPSTRHNVTNRPGRDPNIIQDGVLIQTLPAASTQSNYSPIDIAAVPAPYISPYATTPDLCQQRLGHFSPSVGDASELSDSSRTLHNTPELSSSSRNSSMSAIAESYLPARNSSYGSFHFIPGSPFSNHTPSISDTSNPYIPAQRRSQSGSSHTFQERASGEACKVIIGNVKAGVTHEQLSELIKQKMRLYVQHEKPERGEDNQWRVRFFKEEDAQVAKERLHNYYFKGKKLEVHLSGGSSRRKISSGGSSTSATSSTITPGPTIVDGSITG